ncbi:MAG: hypothetical protein QOI74_2709, partial [Micromonosporaceae bacterium]|nr:hypothetical protein [Micromonosporaceae bacterium]
MSEGLGRRYRRLLRVYPPGARRDELLDTLLQAAAPGRRGPTVRESANLLRHGIRARLGRPGSTAVVVFAVLVAVVGGFLGAAAAARLSWEAARPLPSGTEAGQLRATVFPGLTVWGGGDAALFVERNDREGIRYGYADYWVKHTSATRDVRPFTEAARDRLRAAGWRIRGDVTPIVEPGTAPTADSERLTGAFWATRDGLALDFSDVYRPGGAADGSDGAALFHLSRTKPAWVDPAAVLGALLGALIGWLLTGWVSRRTERRARASLLVGAATGVAVVLVTPALLLMSLGLVLGGGSPSAQPPTAPFWAPLLDLGQGPVKTAGILAVVVVGVAAWRRPSLPRRAATPPQPWRTQVVPIGALVALLVLLWGGGWGRGGGLVGAAKGGWATRSLCTPTVPPAGPDP